MDINIQDKYYNKYIKYKTKYLELKEQSGGRNPEVYGKIQSDQNGGMAYTPAYCKKGLNFIPPRYKMCNIYYYNNINKGDVETYLKNNLVNEYKDDLKKKGISYDENTLENFNTYLKTKLDEAYKLYDKPDNTFKTLDEKVANQDKIPLIKKEVLKYIDDKLGNMAFKEHLKEILETYFNSAYNLAVEIRSTEQINRDKTNK